MFIESKLGPGEQTVGGQIYVFTKDSKGRFTTKVTNLVHVQCFLAIEHYAEVKDEALPISVAEKPPVIDTVMPDNKTQKADKKADEAKVKDEALV